MPEGWFKLMTFSPLFSNLIWRFSVYFITQYLWNTVNTTKILWNKIINNQRKTMVNDYLFESMHNEIWRRDLKIIEFLLPQVCRPC